MASAALDKVRGDANHFVCSASSLPALDATIELRICMKTSAEFQCGTPTGGPCLGQGPSRTMGTLSLQVPKLRSCNPFSASGHVTASALLCSTGEGQPWLVPGAHARDMPTPGVHAPAGRSRRRRGPGSGRGRKRAAHTRPAPGPPAAGAPAGATLRCVCVCEGGGEGGEGGVHESASAGQAQTASGPPSAGATRAPCQIGVPTAPSAHLQQSAHHVAAHSQRQTPRRALPLVLPQR